LNGSISGTIDEEALVCRYIQARNFAESYSTHNSCKVLKDCVSNDPRNPAFLCSLSVVLFETNEVEEALTYAKRAVEEDESIPEILFNYSVLLERISREQEAVQYYEKLERFLKFEDFAKSRLEIIREGKEKLPENSLRERVVHLNHPTNIMKEGLKIYKKKVSQSSKEIKQQFNTLSTKKMSHQSKSPDRTVRFDNIASSRGSIDSERKVDYPLSLFGKSFKQKAKKSQEIQEDLSASSKPNDKMSFIEKMRSTERNKIKNNPPPSIFNFKPRPKCRK